MNTATLTEVQHLLGDSLFSLSEKDQERLCLLYERERKDNIVYFLWFLWFHYAYFRQWLTCAIFILTMGGMFIWWLIDLFRIPFILKAYNKKLVKELFDILAKNK